MIQIEIYEEFANWLDNLLENNEISPERKAFCFNLYEEAPEENIYSIQLIAAGAFDPADDGDWACEELWSSDEDVFEIDTSDEDDKSREYAQELFKEMIVEYLGNGKHGNILKDGIKGIALGFIDGNLEYLIK